MLRQGDVILRCVSDQDFFISFVCMTDILECRGNG